MKNIGFVYDESLIQDISKSKKYDNRFIILIDLIRSYKLFAHMCRIKPIDLEKNRVYNLLRLFHDEEYIQNFMRLSEKYDYHNSSDSFDLDESFEEFGLMYDCSGFKGLYSYASATVRSTIAAIDILHQKKCQVAINWFGGWHHAKRSQASGFCYFNDISIAIMKLLNSDPRLKVLYLDFDLHHGDGVEDSFIYNKNVLTFSIHHYASGFFPGTGASNSSTGLGREQGATDSDLDEYLPKILPKIYDYLNPDYIIVQLGADGLSNDPHKIFNFTVSKNTGLIKQVIDILKWKKPTLFLGGGGYHFADTSRLWTCATATIIKHFNPFFADLSDDIPENDSFSYFGPDFALHTTQNLISNSNSPKYLEAQVTRLLSQLEQYKAINEHLN